MDEADFAVYERLVPSGEAFELLIGEHDRRGTYSDFERCKIEVLKLLVARLADGHLAAWSVRCSIDSSIDTGGFSLNQIVSPWDFYRNDSGVPKKIPIEFWWHFQKCSMPVFDPIANDFRFEYTDNEYSMRTGYAYDVYFDPKGLPSIAIPSWIDGAKQPPTVRQNAEVDIRQSNKGRRPANWWPDFAEELAIYIHEEGLPEGIGTDGQSIVIDAVFRRLAVRGKPEPSRSTVQPVINAVLRRLRSAGKN